MPTPDEQRAEVVELARTGLGRNEVSRRTGIPATTVSRIAAEAGVSFDRSATATATEARIIDAKARRTVLSLDLLDDLAEARARLHRTTEARDFVDCARAISLLTNAHVRLVAVDGTDQGVEEAKSMLGGLFGMLRQAYADGAATEDTPAALEGSEEGAQP